MIQRIEDGNGEKSLPPDGFGPGVNYRPDDDALLMVVEPVADPAGSVRNLGVVDDWLESHGLRLTVDTKCERTVLVMVRGIKNLMEDTSRHVHAGDSDLPDTGPWVRYAPEEDQLVLAWMPCLYVDMRWFESDGLVIGRMCDGGPAGGVTVVDISERVNGYEESNS